MQKNIVLGLVNIALAGLFVLLVFPDLYNTLLHLSFKTFINYLIPDAVLIGFSLLNGFLAYKFIMTNEKKPLYSPLTFFTLFWFLLFLIGVYVPSIPVFIIITLILITLVFFYMRMFTTKIAVVLSVITLFVSVISMTANFEENYCLGKSAEADPSGQKVMIASKQDSIDLQDFNIHPGDKIGVAFRAHMLCHKTFNLGNALHEKYKI